MSGNQRVEKLRLRLHRAARLQRAGFSTLAARLFDREYDSWFEMGDGHEFCKRLHELYLKGGIFAEDCRACRRWVPGAVINGEGWQ